MSTHIRFFPALYMAASPISNLPTSADGMVIASFTSYIVSSGITAESSILFVSPIAILESVSLPTISPTDNVPVMAVVTV